ncbi:hypothetical protein [Bacillus sp. MUM 116]|nr:hypothetical protein [Bacillus sp. MUM 116]
MKRLAISILATCTILASVNVGSGVKAEDRLEAIKGKLLIVGGGLGDLKE